MDTSATVLAKRAGEAQAAVDSARAISLWEASLEGALAEPFNTLQGPGDAGSISDCLVCGRGRNRTCDPLVVIQVR